MKKKTVLRFSMLAVMLAVVSSALAEEYRYNFNMDWHYIVGDKSAAEFHAVPADAREGAVAVSLPRAFNEDDAFRVEIARHRDTVSWWYKHFELPAEAKDKQVFVEFEGVRQAAEVYLNGKYVGLSENGVMAFGFNLTPYLKEGSNELSVRIDNDWDYREKATNTKHQWNNRNFNVNYGGITKNVWLHFKGDVYQTLPLYSNLGTTGVYVYGTDYDIKKRRATVNVESQIINSSNAPRRVKLQIEVLDAEGKSVARFSGKSLTVAAGDTAVVKAQKRLSDLHFWSWGYGYLYTVKSMLVAGGDVADEVIIRTGFRKTRFGEGKVWLNDRVIQLKGFAQRSSNEWPSVGQDVPAWLSDYSNDLMVKTNANLVRWMHVTPSKQDIESCDRVGLIQAMPAGDAEKDCQGRQWIQRTELMRDAIIYNRNNPSVIFYECGNESISREHMIEMKAIRDKYDPYGGRAIGSREMLDIDEAEYGGEMLYLNKSAKHPMWAMEYCRDEGYRMYWDNWSYPWHQHGAGPLHRNASASSYNQNQDSLTIEQIERWNDYYVLRPGMGKRVSSGGVKIIFSETNTHDRSEFNYRVSGVVDAMRIPKDGFFAHQVMWDGWVDIENPRTYIIGHWNYQVGIVKPVHVVSNCEQVELFLNNKSLGQGTRKHTFLFSFDNVSFQPGTLRAVGKDSEGNILSEYTLSTAGTPAALRLKLIQSPTGMKADGSDLALVEVEVVDKDGRRCPLDNRMIDWTLTGEATWRGGIARSGDLDNHILDTMFPVEAGVNRVLVRSTCKAGVITLKAEAKGLPAQTIQWETKPIETVNGLSAYMAGRELPCILDRGETPLTPSYTDKKLTVDIVKAESAANDGTEVKAFDDNELSGWSNDGKRQTAWITFELADAAAIDEISIKLTGWRQRSYPLEVAAELVEDVEGIGKKGDNVVVWKGTTPKSLGYVSLDIKNPVKALRYTIRQIGQAKDQEAFGQIVELDAAQEEKVAKARRGDLRIREVDFLVHVK